MTDVPEGAQLSEDGQWWWDGEQWQPVGGAGAEAPSSSSSDASTVGSPDDASMSSEQQSTNQINADDFPSLARVLYFGEDVDGYLQDLGIDTSDLDSDEPTGPLVS
jgi:hypothetical protein